MGFFLRDFFSGGFFQADYWGPEESLVSPPEDSGPRFPEGRRRVLEGARRLRRWRAFLIAMTVVLDEAESP